MATKLFVNIPLVVIQLFLKSKERSSVRLKSNKSNSKLESNKSNSKPTEPLN